MIGDINNKGKNVNRKFRILKELSALKKNIMFNHKENLNYE